MYQTDSSTVPRQSSSMLFHSTSFYSSLVEEGEHSSREPLGKTQCEQDPCALKPKPKQTALGEGLTR